jgi:hypothetical protein
MRMAEQLVTLLGPVSVGVDGPEAEVVAAALGTGGLPAVVADGRAMYDVVVAVGGADGATIDEARSFVSSVTARAGLAVVFTSRRGYERSVQWWDDLFVAVGFEVRDVLRARLWDDSSWDAHGLTGLTLYARVSERARISGAAPPAIPRSALHPGVLATSRRADARAYELIDRFELYDPAIEDPIETLGNALARHKGEAEDARREAEAAASQWQADLDRVLAETRAMDAARAWEADSRAHAEAALARAAEESALLRQEVDDLVAASALARMTSPSVARQFGRRATSAAWRRLETRGLGAVDGVASRLSGRAGVYAKRAVAVYRSMTTDWLDATRELFDTDHYLAQRPGLIGSGVDPVVHYAKVGWRRGLDPHPLFDTDWYLRTNAALLAADVSPLEHFVSQGWREGCDPHPLFDTDFYVRRDVEVAVEDVNPLVHYIHTGWREGRDPHPIFETRRYLDDHPEVDESGQCPLVHYVLFGWQLGYRPSELFDPEWYVEHYPEAVTSGLPPYRYYLEVGVRRGDRPSAWAEQLDRTDGESDGADLVSS